MLTEQKIQYIIQLSTVGRLLKKITKGSFFIMKKSLVTLVAAATLVAAVAPATTVFANNTYNVESQKANATVAELGREYALAYANAAVAKTNAEGAARDYNTAESALLEIKAEEKRVVEAKQAVLDAAKLKWDNATVEVLKFTEAGNTEAATQTQTLIDTTYAPAVAAATADLADTEEAYAKKVAEKQAAFDEAAKVKQAADAELAAAVAAKEAAYNKAINAGAKPADLKAAETSAPAAPAKAKAATSAATGAKTLPKTSAVK